MSRFSMGLSMAVTMARITESKMSYSIACGITPVSVKSAPSKPAAK